MKTILLLEDTPDGIQAELRWQDNGVQDHLPDSVAMNVMGNLIRLMKNMQDSGAVRIVSEKF